MKRRLVPVVEIVTRPPIKSKARSLSESPTPTEFIPTNPSHPSKKKRIDSYGERQTSAGIPISPTVSDFENTESYNKFPISPTVSDFIACDTSTTDLTIGCSTDETLPPSWPRTRRSLSTSVATGSNVTLDAIPTSYEDLDDSEVYELKDDELLEDDDLVIPGETPAENLSHSSNEESDIPVRVLRDFTIYDISTNVLVPVAALTALKYSDQIFGASGLVAPYIDEDEEFEVENEDSEEDSTSEVVKLSKIIEFDIHSFSEATDTLDSKIYLRTKYAWYILDSPSQQYRQFFVPFWIQHRVLHLMITAFTKTPRIKYEEFLDSIQENNISDGDFNIEPPTEELLTCVTMLGRTLTEADVQSDDVKAYVAASLPDICGLHGLRFKSVPLLQSYLGANQLDLYTDDCSATSRRRNKKTKAFRNMSLKKSEQEVLKHRHTTVVTPVVSRIAKNLFNGALEIAGACDIEDNDVVAEMDHIKAHHTDPESMRWGQEPEEGESYRSIIMDGVEYCVGDSVMVNPGDDEDKTRARNARTDAAQSPNLYANHLWFCRICYFYEEQVNGEKVKMFHGQWYLHGSKTILQQTAHSKSLNLLYKCEDNPAASIFKKCNVTILASEDQESPDDAKPDSNDFHCALVYDEKEASFRDIPRGEEIEQMLAFLPSHKPCISCGVQRREEAYEQFTNVSGGFSRYGVDYHNYDFIYIRPNRPTGLLEIAQILEIENTADIPILMVQYFGRDDEACRSGKDDSSDKLRFDERRLYLKEGARVLGNPNLIEGVCYVRQLADPVEIEEWVEHNDHFYTNFESGTDDNSDIQEDTMRSCKVCFHGHIKELQEGRRLLERNGPIVCLELFSGAGGLGTGLDMSGYVETRYAVEFSPSAAATYKSNHPHAMVYCQDSSVLLRHAIETDAGANPLPLMSNDGKTRLPLLPKKNAVDMISGGPPCQSFSRANHNPRADDVRSTLPGNMLSYVEHYNPRYFLLENVAGLLSHRLMSTRGTDKRSLQGGIEGGMIKFIMRSLIALGYQVRFKLLQAGQYGAPQSRRRVIFWGAKRGVTIPDYPVPQYALPRGMNRTTLPTGDYLYPVSRSLDPNDYHQCAPLPAITVNDTIGDLPPFDWVNPHEVIPITQHDKREIARRRQQGIDQFEADIRKRDMLPGYLKGTKYASEPMNRYQKWLRAEMANIALQGHYTKSFSSKIIEATTTVPMKPWADHRDLPLVLQPNYAKPGAKQAEKSFYGRMDGASQFKCAMTVAAPNVKHSWLLHPTQKRIMTVRECARAQGFPDHYVFESEDAEQQKLVANQIRQIGNAVPIPLALHLGKSLGKALIREWERNEREGSPIV